VNLPPQVSVAVFLTRFEPGGTERQMTELIRRLDPSRFRVHVACFDRRGAWLPRVAEHAVSIVEFPIRGFAHPGTISALLRFARWCRRERIEVLQTCDFYANILGLPAAALAGVPVRIGSRRDLNPDKSPAQIRLQRQAYRCATTVVANCAAARDILLAEGLKPASIAVIPNGVDGARYESAGLPSVAAKQRGLPSVAAKQRGLPSVAAKQRRRVITVANLRPEKNHETLIAAADLLSADFPDVEFQIVGDGVRRPELEALVRSRRVDDRVSFLGHREDVGRLLSEASIFVLPSRSEAFPNGAIEAMAAGLPVVASAVGGLLDLIDHGRTGLLVEPGNPTALADALRRLLTNPAAAAQIGERARADVQQRYSFERMVKAFEDLYLAGLPARGLSGTRHPQAAGI
jgi:glycosyltransferase involved in cell wall biosynthesis